MGNEFLAALDLFYETLLINPETYSFYERPVRQGSINRFSYTVVYELFGEVIVIYSVFMSRRNPDEKRSG